MGAKLTEKAMLVDLSVGYWRGKAKDRQVTRDVHARMEAASDAGVYEKALVGKDRIGALAALAWDARAFHLEHTLPWMDKGCRILTCAAFGAYQKAMTEFKTKFEELGEEFLAAYDDTLEEARRRLGRMFKVEDYPTKDEIRRKLLFDVRVSPVPEAGDFRVELDGEEVGRMRRELEERSQAALAEAMRSLWERVRVVVEHLAERLGDPKAIFRDTLVSNAQELCDLLPALNVTDDPNLEAVRKAVVDRLCGTDPQTLREDAGVRKEVAKAAEDILGRMAGFMGAEDL
jgi:hypothetical protein